MPQLGNVRETAGTGSVCVWQSHVNLLNLRRFVCLSMPRLQVSFFKQTPVSLLQDLHISLDILMIRGFVWQANQIRLDAKARTRLRGKMPVLRWITEQNVMNVMCKASKNSWMLKVQEGLGPCTAVQSQSRSVKNAWEPRKPFVWYTIYILTFSPFWIRSESITKVFISGNFPNWQWLIMIWNKKSAKLFFYK